MFKNSTFPLPAKLTCQLNIYIKQIEEDDSDNRKLPANGHDDNKAEEEGDNNDDKDNNIIYNNPRHSLPNCTHHDLDDLYDVASKQADQASFAKVNVGGVAMHIITKSTFGKSNNFAY